MYSVLRSLLPPALKNRLNDLLLKAWENKREALDSDLPFYDLEQGQIAHAEILLNREAMLARLPAGGVVAEIGVDRGDFSQKILDITNPRKLHLVDMWGSQQYPDSLQQIVEVKFRRQIEEGLVEINRGFSTEVGKQFPDHYFDWVYIDTDHSYPTTKAELEIYSEKVKPGGVLAGHDFTRGNWKRGVRYGVKEAVYEFCYHQGWEFLFLTMENSIPQSFAIRKMP